MLLKTKGIAHGITVPIVGRVSFTGTADAEILICDIPPAKLHSPYKAVLSKYDGPSEIPGVFSIRDSSHLAEGDIVVLHSDGIVNTQYRVNSPHNFLLFTERCNSNCLMCSQPPRDRDDTDYLYHLHSQTIPLIPKDCFELGITGGEPTLMGERFFMLMNNIKNALPDTEVHCLTNGRSFAWANVADKLGRMDFNRLMLGIPIYADYPPQHDYIVQARDAFSQTVKGLYHLARNDVRIELRIVLHQQTIPRLRQLSRFIYKNFPFVEHVTFMGLEHQGYTPHNISKLWIDPLDYSSALTDSVTFLDDMGMNVSIYNSQLCVLPKELWQYARKSISDWKNVYHEECSKCTVKEACGGLFASGIQKHSRGLHALAEYPKENH